MSENIISISYKNLLRRKSRTFLSVLGISLGIMMIIVLVSLSQGLQDSVENTLGKLQNIQVLEKGKPSPLFSVMDESYLDKIRSVNGVRTAMPFIIGIPSSIEGKAIKGANPVMGTDINELKNLKSVSIFEDSIIRGRFFQNNNEKGLTVLGKNVAEDYNKKVGDSIKVEKNNFKVIGIMKTDSALYDGAIMVNLEEARVVKGIDKGIINMIEVEPTIPSESEKLSNKIELLFTDLGARTGEEAASDVAVMLVVVESLTIVISGIAAFVGGIGVLNTMLMSVMERTKEIGVLKAVGWNNKTVLQMILIESIIISFLGLISGILVGGLIVWQVLPLFGINGVINLKLLVLATVFSLSLGLMGGIYPSIRASKMSPLEAFRNE